ncbi:MULTISPECIES: hypothetical protein [Gordonia]|uniref:hypothetical protein n=1 Tax=Gordonia TaxID=2053 RepID=UPI00128F259D|nr:hypothetical protein [Gordonia sp. NB41Y]WLP93301.1 hypothetical protein Q9K23_18860 [Gordonia sp. NB41Y]
MEFGVHECEDGAVAAVAVDVSVVDFGDHSVALEGQPVQRFFGGFRDGDQGVGITGGEVGGSE